MSTIPYGGAAVDYCSAPCLIAAVEELRKTGDICGFDHSLDADDFAKAGIPAPDDAPRCYVKGCGETENLEPCFVGEYVCPECKASQQHQRNVAGEFALEGAEG